MDKNYCASKRMITTNRQWTKDEKKGRNMNNEVILDMSECQYGYEHDDVIANSIALAIS